MNWLSFFDHINNALGTPSTILFLGVAIFLTIKNKFIQLRAGTYFVQLITQRKQHVGNTTETIGPFQALFTAMATTIGIGNIVGPSIAIVAGGPGALFWIIAYAFFASVTKFTEVTFGVATRKKDPDGTIIGGPMQYLKSVSPFLANWYNGVMIFLFAGWSGIQANTLASMLAEEHIPQWQTGLVVSFIAFWVLIGGAHRIGGLASKIVPIKFVIYIVFALGILLKDIHALGQAVMLVIQHIFTPTAALGGFMGATVLQAMRSGIYRGIYITEAGTGTAAIPHSLANVKKPSDQGVLAMYSIFAEIFLCTLSGLIVLVTGVWEGSTFSNTLIYKAFKMHAPSYGHWLLIASISLFALTTTIGNSFNGSQSFSAFFGHKMVRLYYLFCIIIIFCGSLMSVPLIWSVMDVLLTLVAIPNLIGLVILTFKNPKVLEI